MSVEPDVMQNYLLYEFELSHKVADAFSSTCTAFEEGAAMETTSLKWFRFT